MKDTLTDSSELRWLDAEMLCGVPRKELSKASLPTPGAAASATAHSLQNKRGVLVCKSDSPFWIPFH